MIEPEGNGTGDAGSEGKNLSATTPIASTAKLELKDGAVLVDGKKFVAESDLIAAKHGLEGRLSQADKVHGEAIDKAKLELSDAQKQIATLNAKITENEQARKSGAVTDEAAAKIKTELEVAKSSMEQVSKSALEYRRALLTVQYGVNADTIKDKDMKSLDAFEEALKAVIGKGSGGIGPYAVRAGSGGEATPQTPMERAAKILASTPVRGTRQAEVAK